MLPHPSPSIWDNWDTTGMPLPSWQQEDKSQQQEPQQRGATAKHGHWLHPGMGQLGDRAEGPWRESRAQQLQGRGGLDQAFPARQEQH